MRPAGQVGWCSCCSPNNLPFFSLPTLVCPQSSKHEERKQQQLLEAMTLGGGSVEKPEKKEKSSKTKDKGMRDKNVTEEEKELRKERKLGRKRVCKVLIIPHRNLGFMFLFLCTYITVFHSQLKYSFWKEDVVLNRRMTMPGELGSKWSYSVLKCYPTVFMERLMKIKNKLKDSHLQSKNWTWDLLSMKQEFLHLPVMFVSTVVWWANVPVCRFLWNVGWQSAFLWVITHQVVVISYYSLQNNLESAVFNCFTVEAWSYALANKV